MRERQTLFKKRCGLCGQLTHHAELSVVRFRVGNSGREVKVCLYCFDKETSAYPIRDRLRDKYGR